MARAGELADRFNKIRELWREYDAGRVGLGAHPPRREPDLPPPHAARELPHRPPTIDVGAQVTANLASPSLDDGRVFSRKRDGTPVVVRAEPRDRTYTLVPRPQSQGASQTKGPPEPKWLAAERAYAQAIEAAEQQWKAQRRPPSAQTTSLRGAFGPSGAPTKSSRPQAAPTAAKVALAEPVLPLPRSTEVTSANFFGDSFFERVGKAAAFTSGQGRTLRDPEPTRTLAT